MVSATIIFLFSQTDSITMRIQTINPFTEDPLEIYSSMVRPDVDDLVDNARKALESWRETTIRERI